ncbi:MAG: helix-turn-helix domain-containing protein [Saprospiraceae bacterium]
MNLSVLQFILLAGALQGVLLTLLLLTRRTNILANRLLGALVFLISLQSVLVAFDERAFFIQFPHLSKIGWLLPTLFGPLVYLFTQKLTSEKPQLYWRDALHLLPFMLFLAFLMPYYLQSSSEKIAYLNDFEKARQDDFGWLNQVLNLLHVFYLALSFRTLQQYQRNILNQFSETERIRLEWLRQFLLFLLIILALSVPIFYAKKWQIPYLSDLYGYHYLLVIAYIYWIGYKALSQTAIFDLSKASVAALLESEAPNLQLTAAKYQKSQVSEDLLDAYELQVLAYMEQAKPYLQNDLTIQELAALTNIPRHHLSQVINSRLDKNFYDFVNGYRVKAAQEMLHDPRYSHWTNLAIAEAAGFNSKATFNAVFKKMTGQTPSEFVKSQSEVG